MVHIEMAEDMSSGFLEYFRIFQASKVHKAITQTSSKTRFMQATYVFA